MRDSKHPHVQGQIGPSQSSLPGSSDYSHGVTESCKQSQGGGTVGEAGRDVLPERQMALYSVEMALTLSGLWLE